MKETQAITISAKEMKAVFESVLLKYGYTKDRAAQCAGIFTDNTVDGVSSHGINRFERFVEYTRKGYIKAGAVPSLKNKAGSLEQWNGNLGPGPSNAIYATERAVQLAKENGLGCVALANTNHWMRAGYYGWYAAKKGFVFIGWTNTIANMPAWGAKDRRLGNNPLVFAIPYNDEAIVMDMAMSQFSFGKMEQAVLKNEKLSMDGGYNKEGEVTNDPAAILESKRPFPIGYWKGAGLSLLLDLLATILADGSSTKEISEKEREYGLSQVFICFDISKLENQSSVNTIVKNIIADYHLSVPVDEKTKIVYPGEMVLQKRKENLENGVHVLKEVWDKILQL